MIYIHSTIFKHNIRVFDCWFLFYFFYFGCVFPISNNTFLFSIIPIDILFHLWRARTSQYTRLYDRNQNYFFLSLGFDIEREKKIENGYYHRQCSLKSFFLFNFLQLYIGSGNVVCKRECKVTYREYGTTTCKQIHMHDMHTNTRTNIHTYECARVERNTQLNRVRFYILLFASSLSLACSQHQSARQLSILL